MRSFSVALVCLVVVATSAEYGVKTLAEVRQAQDECLVENNVPVKIVEQLKKFRYPNEPVVLDYLICVGEHLGVWDPKKGWNIEHIKQQFKFDYDLTKATETFNECRDKHQTGDDAKAWLVPFQQCLGENNIVLSQIIKLS